jgi:hypothetical protein
MSEAIEVAIEKKALEKQSMPTQSETNKKAVSGSEITHSSSNIIENSKETYINPALEDLHKHNKVWDTVESLTASKEKEPNSLSELETMAKNLLARPEVTANARISRAWSKIEPDLQPLDLREYQVVIGSQDNKSERFIITSVPGLVKDERCIMIRYFDPDTRREHKLDNWSSDLNKWIVFRYKSDSPTHIAITTGKVDNLHYKDEINKNWQQHIWEENAERLINYTSWDQLKPEEINDLLSKFKQKQERNIKLPENYAKSYRGDISRAESQLHEALRGGNPFELGRGDLWKYEMQDMLGFLSVLSYMFKSVFELIWFALKNPRINAQLALEKLLFGNLTQEEIDNFEKLTSNVEHFLKAEEKALVQNVNYGEIFEFYHNLLGATNNPSNKTFLMQKNILQTLLHRPNSYSAIKTMQDGRKLFELVDKAKLMPTLSRLTHMRNYPKSVNFHVAQ